MIPLRFPDLRATVLVLLASALPAGAWALPEDDAQQIVSDDYASFDYELNTGVFVQKAHPGRPTCVTQGSRVICGAEIRVERAEDGSVSKVTATGTPARFEQQPAADEEIVHFSGLTLVYDKGAQLLTIDGEASFSQGTTELTHRHIEYHIDTGTLSANRGSSDEDEGGHMRFTPPPATN